MKILLTNDDGIYAEGIKTLAKILFKNNHQLAVVSPDSEKSASGHSISLHNPLRAKKVRFNDLGLKNIDCFKVEGTPVDCVKLGIDTLIDFKPDLIISGINHGANLGYDVLYSGTVAAAIEGWMMGYPSVAVSLNINKYNNFYMAANILVKIIFTEVKKLIQNQMLLNINIPDLKKNQINDIFITSLSDNLYDDYYENRKDPLGNNYYWLKGDLEEKVEKNTDIWALNHKNISITPLKINLTSEKDKEILKEMHFKW